MVLKVFNTFLLPNKTNICFTRYDEKTRNLIAEADKARKEFEDGERRLRDLDRELTKLKVNFCLLKQAKGMEDLYGLNIVIDY